MNPVRTALPRLLLIIVGLGLLLRIIFLVIGAPVFYHSATDFYFNGDSSSYTQSFENWWRTGYYTFDFQEPDAAVGRLPGYPLFYGIIRLVTGPSFASAGVAWVQVILDSATIMVVYGCLRRLAPSQQTTALFGAFLYATYPFIIIWTPIVGTECLSTDLTLLWVYGLLNWRSTTRYALAMGVLAAINLYVREYMAVIFPATLLFILLREWKSGRFTYALVRLSILVILGFSLLYLAWPVRNYISLHRIILLKPRTAGYANFTPEVAEYNAWVHCWTNNENPWRDSILIGSPAIRFPADVFPTRTDAVRASYLVSQARTCGSGYYVQRRGMGPYPVTTSVIDTAYERFKLANCNETTGAGFADLRTNFRKAFPARYWLAVPWQNFWKTFFKSETNASQTGAKLLMQQGVFAYRSLLLLAGWIGLIVFGRRNIVLLVVASLVCIIYAYMWFVMRGVEMRYLLQTDVLLLLPAALLLHRVLHYVLQRFRPAIQAKAS